MPCGRVVRYLTDLADTASVPPRLPADVETRLGRGREPRTSAPAA